MPKPKERMKMNHVRNCNHCGARLSGVGRASDDGIYYCSNKRECRAAKARVYYASRISGGQREKPDAATRCFLCGEGLPARKVRRGDDPEGRRWCRKAACQRNRVQAEEGSRLAAGGMTREQADLLLEFADAASNPELVGECGFCHQERAVDGFIHPRPRGGVCYHVGDKGISKEIAKKRWPDSMVG